MNPLGDSLKISFLLFFIIKFTRFQQFQHFVDFWNFLRSFQGRFMKNFSLENFWKIWIGRCESWSHLFLIGTMEFFYRFLFCSFSVVTYT